LVAPWRPEHSRAAMRRATAIPDTFPWRTGV